MNKLFTLLFSCFLLSFAYSVYGQVSNYSFTQVYGQVPYSSQGWEQIFRVDPDGGPDQMKRLYVGPGTAYTTADSAKGPGLPIGFDFKYDGQVFDRFAIAANGYIKLGRSSDSIVILNDTIAGAVFASGKDAARANVISAFQKTSSQFAGFESMIECRTAGFPGERRLVVSFGYGNLLGNNNMFGYVIRLFEGSNKIEVDYYQYSNPTFNINAAIGLRGGILNNAMSNLSIRRISFGNETWQNSSPGTTQGDLAEIRSGFTPPYQSLPQTNMIYTWSPAQSFDPPACPIGYFHVDSAVAGRIKAVPDSFYVFANNAVSVATTTNLYWSEAYVVPTVYDVYFGLDSNALALVSQGQSTNHYDPGVMASNAVYYYRVIARNANGTSTGCIGRFTTSATPAYCYPYPRGNFLLQNFHLSTLLYTYTNTGSNPPYIMPSNIYTTSLERGQIYSFNTSSRTFSGPSYDLMLYFDFNQDGDFTDSDENFHVGLFPSNYSRSVSISIPLTARLGATVMRVAMKMGDDFSPWTPCFCSGGFIDFTINILPTTSCQGFSISPVLTSPPCFGQSTGSINLNPSGGLSPYTASWTASTSTSVQRTSLGLGTYEASITDANGCEVSTPVMALLQPAPLLLDTNLTHSSGSGGTIDLMVSGGTLPYTYSWSDASVTEDLYGLIPGLYSVTVTDANECQEVMNNIQINIISGINGMDSKAAIAGIYPNPASDVLHIFSPKETPGPLHVEILGIYGSSVSTWIYNGGNGAIDISDIPLGIYMIRITNGAEIRLEKLLID